MKLIIPAITLLMTLSACCDKPAATPEPKHKEVNAVYYWKTVFDLNKGNIAYLNSLDIHRIYLRMFDVTVNSYDNPEAEEYTIPNATVKFTDLTNRDDYVLKCNIDSIMQRDEFVPVVYITLEALKEMSGKESTLASNIVTRVNNMRLYHELPNVGELQLDCDWTPLTEQSYFRLCEAVKKCIESLNLDWRLSSTIRLHQLTRKVPPVDRGVLMVYNTGNFSDPDAENSIISLKDVKPYLKHLRRYPLHLDVAYPTYSWQLLFHKRKFVGLLNGLELADTTRFAPAKQNTYRVLRDIPYNTIIIRAGDMIRQESSDVKDIAAIKAEIEKRLDGRPHSNILYHLDSDNLSKYSRNELQEILSTRH